MRLWAWSPHNETSALLEEEAIRAPFLSLLCEDTVRRGPSVSQGESPDQELGLGLHSLQEISICCLSLSIYRPPPPIFSTGHPRPEGRTLRTRMEQGVPGADLQGLS